MLPVWVYIGTTVLGIGSALLILWWADRGRPWPFFRPPVVRAAQHALRVDPDGWQRITATYWSYRDGALWLKVDWSGCTINNVRCGYYATQLAHLLSSLDASRIQDKINEKVVT